MASFQQNSSYQFQSQEDKILNIEIIKGRLYWLSSEDPPTDIHYFNIDNKLKYLKYYKDFGPACIANIVNFCRVVRRYIFHDDTYKDKPLFFHSSNEKEKQANAALLISSFQVIVLNRSAESVWEKIKDLDLLPFRDASYNERCEYQCSILDCLKAIRRSIDLGWFNLETFDIKYYEKLEDQESGNISVIIPNKILAFRGPLSQYYQEKHQKLGRYYRITVNQLVIQLKALKTSTVVRCNSPEEYDREDIINQGIDHSDLFFPDGSCPKDDIINQFIDIVDNSKGYVGVHCKAGLGRTGTLIACYAIQKYNFPAREIIAWIRLCRSGCILGKQQLFLLHFEQSLVQQGLFKQEQPLDISEINSQKSTTVQILQEKQTNGNVEEQFKQQNQKEKKSNLKLNLWSCFSMFKKKNLGKNISKLNLNNVDFYKEEPNQAEKLLECQNNNLRAKSELSKQQIKNTQNTINLTNKIKQ